MWSSLAVEGKRTMPQNQILDNLVTTLSRPNTGFQVKVPDMPRSAILEEMAPDGNLRPVIQELARKQGAYVIVSSHGSTADGPLQNRVLAMQETLLRAFLICQQSIWIFTIGIDLQFG